MNAAAIKVVPAPADPWKDYSLRTILSEPRRHELLAPDGTLIKLNASDFLSVQHFSAKFLDATGKFPALPDKFKGKYLQALAEQWFQTRVTIQPEEEASEIGLLRSDVRDCLRGAPESDSGLDLERGAVVIEPDRALFSSRILLERVRRAHPYPFKPHEFHESLSALGCLSLGSQRVGVWRGRVWSAPLTVARDTPELDGLSRAVTPLPEKSL